MALFMPSWYGKEENWYWTTVSVVLIMMRKLVSSNFEKNLSGRFFRHGTELERYRFRSGHLSK